MEIGRRDLFAIAAIAAEFGVLGARSAQAASASAFPALRQIDAGPLSIGYVDMGPPSGAPVILLHGWPYDIHTFVEVAPLLVQAGHRVIVPYLRGYGSTVFRSADTMRNGQQAAMALDVIALMDALNIRRAVLGGCDWGARAADGVAAMAVRRRDLRADRPCLRQPRSRRHRHPQLSLADGPGAGRGALRRL